MRGDLLVHSNVTTYNGQAILGGGRFLSEDEMWDVFIHLETNKLRFKPFSLHA